MNDQDRELADLSQALIAEETISPELRARTLRTIDSERARAIRVAETGSNIKAATVAALVAALAFSPQISIIPIVLVLAFAALYAGVLEVSTRIDGFPEPPEPLKG